MTAEPIRQPDDETDDPERQPTDESPAPQPDTAEPDAPSASESLTETAVEPVTAPGDSLTPEAAASAEAEAAAESHRGSADSVRAEAATDAESDPNMDPDASEAAVAAADSQEVATTAQAVATIDAATDADVTTPADTAATDKRSRRTAAGRALRQLMVVVIGVALLLAGIAIGNSVFLSTRPAQTGGPGDPALGLADPPAATQEFISALSVNDADALRSSLDREPHIDLMREMERRGIQKVDQVQVLGTSVDGPRSATEILMQFEREDGISSAINLVILTDDGKIEGFR